MFNKEYFKYLEGVLKSYIPSGYSIKVIDELSFGQRNMQVETDFDIYCVIRFGSASRLRGATNNIIQPITFTVISESGSVETSRTMLQQVFQFLNTTESSLEVVEDGVSKYYDIIGNFFSPTILPNAFVLNSTQRHTLLMTGTINYSDNRFKPIVSIGNYVINDLISFSVGYNTSAKSPNYVNGNTEVLIEGGNNIYNLSFRLVANEELYNMLEIAHTSSGNKIKLLEYEYTSSYGNKEYSINTKIIGINVSYLKDNGDIVIEATFMRESI